jgi:hypothetical protein
MAGVGLALFLLTAVVLGTVLCAAACRKLATSRGKQTGVQGRRQAHNAPSTCCVAAKQCGDIEVISSNVGEQRLSAS